MSSNYHERIMNAQIAKPNISDQVSWSERERLAYKFGHRDARYAAAEIANEADRQVKAAEGLAEALRITLFAYSSMLTAEHETASNPLPTENDEAVLRARAALAAWTAAKEGR